MLKGFILFKDGKIPFVVQDYHMELFTDDDLLEDFIKEYNFKKDYTLEGQCFHDGIGGQQATFLIEHSMGSTCYLRCYIIHMLHSENTYDTIGFESLFLDDIFRFKYEYLDKIRSGVNLSIEPQDIYKIPFNMDEFDYEMIFRIGYDNRLGLLEDLDRKGELLIKLHTIDIQECYNIAIILHRFAMFMTSHQEVPFKCVTLYDKGFRSGWFYFPYISKDVFSGYDIHFHKLDVIKYVPKILNNISLDSGNKITQSVPLGHLCNSDSLFSPKRFIEQIMSFEYLFEKLEPQKAKDRGFHLKEELKYMFNEFPQLLSNPSLSVEKVCDEIKELRRNITHGYEYYYDFKSDSHKQYLIILLDKLIKKMSLQWIGFSKDDIEAITYL